MGVDGEVDRGAITLEEVVPLVFIEFDKNLARIVCMLNKLLAELALFCLLVFRVLRRNGLFRVLRLLSSRGFSTSSWGRTTFIN